VKGKIFPVHTLKTYRGSRLVVPLIFNLSIRWRPVVNFAPQPLYTWERILVPIEEEAGCTLEPVLTFWSGEKFLGSIEIRNPDCPVNSTVAILTTPPQLIIWQDNG
jgi:hypothetical protein